MSGKARVLIVEDEAVISMMLRLRIQAGGFTVTGVCPSGEAAIASARDQRPDVLVMDIHLQGAMDGISAALEINDHIPVIYVSAFQDGATLERSRSTNTIAFLNKPVDVGHLLHVLGGVAAS